MLTLGHPATHASTGLLTGITGRAAQTSPHAGAAEHAACNAVAEILTPDDILLDLDVPTKERAMEELARFIGARHGLLDRDVHAGLVEREKIGSTALGLGIAIPHARVKGLSHAIAAFVRMKWAILFDAPDGKPVSDMLVLLVPRHATDRAPAASRPGGGDVLRHVVSRGSARLRRTRRGSRDLRQVAAAVNELS